jgi:hypothetical protein
MSVPVLIQELQVPAPSTEVPAARSFLGDCFAWLFGT